MISIAIMLNKHESICSETIQSINNQSVKIDEIVILTNASNKINLEEIESNIKIVVQNSDNGFVSSIRSFIENSDCKYFGIIKNGDVWNRDKIKIQVDKLAFNNASVCLCLTEDMHNSELYSQFISKINDDNYHKLKSLFFYSEFFLDNTCLFLKEYLINISNSIVKEKYLLDIFKKSTIENKLVYVTENLITTVNVFDEVNLGLEKIKKNNERYISYSDFFKNIDNKLFSNIFNQENIYHDMSEKYIRECEEVFLYIRAIGRYNASLRMVGIEKLYKLYDVEEIRAVLIEKYLISNDVLEQLEIICDINCLEYAISNETEKEISKLKVEQFERSKRRTDFLRNKNKINTMPENYKKIVSKIRNKKKIKIAYFVLQSAVFKYEELYKLFDKNESFEQAIVICPMIRNSIDYNIKEYIRSYDYFAKNEYKYNIIKAYDIESDEYVDIKSTYDPDIVFFSSPYNTVPDNLYIYNFEDRLTCFTTYAYHVADMHEMLYNQTFHNLLWKFYIESDLHKKMAIENMDNKAINTVVTGNPGMDGFLYGVRTNSDIWKVKDENVKRIIWAPHHTIEDDDKYSPRTFSTYNNSVTNVGTFKKAEESRASNFTKIYDDMLNLAKRYEGKIQIAFKPHPMLRRKLYDHQDWGIEATDAYYEKWANMENAQLEESAYIELFNSSDAMVFDSGSFIAEYLFCGKPAMYVRRRESVVDVLNEFGKEALEIHYKGYNMCDIYEFIEMVLNNEDVKKNERDTFYNEHLKTPNGKSASQNIYEDICHEINKQV